MISFFNLLIWAWLTPGIIATLYSRSLNSTAPKVKVRNGTYVGFHDPVLNTDNFYGVAYAQPPLGDLRFRQPQSLNTTWPGNRVAVDWPKECVASSKTSSFEHRLSSQRLTQGSSKITMPM